MGDGKKLLDLLPEWHGGSPQTADLMQAMDLVLEELQRRRDRFLGQLDLNQADGGLEFWERAYGIPVEIEKPLDYRRSRVLSKMRGQGTTTREMIQNVAESFTNGAVEVTGRPEGYRFDVKFTGTLGIPPNLEDLTAAIEEIKPAHLAYAYLILYRIWNEVKAKLEDWNRAKSWSWDELKGGATA